MPLDVIMPALGMAQDSGVIVAWLKQPGDPVATGDALFEVETDKATMEVEAAGGGYLTDVTADAGEAVPVGQVIARISETAEGSGEAPGPKADAPKADAPKPDAPASPATNAAPAPEIAASAAPARADGKVLASPKMRRLALQRGLDLRRLADAGHPQPFHVKDLDALRDLPAAMPAAVTGVGARRLRAEVPASDFDAFCDWAAATLDARDPGALLSGFAAASLRTGDAPLIIEIAALDAPRQFTDPDRPWLGRAEPQAQGGPPSLRIRDLRHSKLTSIGAGPEDCPVLTLMQRGETVCVTLECAADQLSAAAAVTLLTDFAGRMEQPLRHLL